MKPNSPGLALGLALACFLSTPFSNAECTLSSFEDGQVASAEDINCNFQVLESEISALSAATPPGRPTVIHVAKEGGDYDSLTTALGNLSSPGAVGGPVLVKIAPGVYQEPSRSQIFWNDVYIEGSGPGVTILEYADVEAAVWMQAIALRSGISNLTIRNSSGPALELEDTGPSYRPRDENSFYIDNVELNAVSSNTVSALKITGPVWARISQSYITAYATTSFKAVRGIEAIGLSELRLSDSIVWANGGFTTDGLRVTDASRLTVQDSEIRISRDQYELGEYSANVGAAVGINIIGTGLTREPYNLGGLVVVVESAPELQNGYGYGIQALAGARVRVFGSNINATSANGNPSYAARANGRSSRNANVGSRIDIVASRIAGDASCTDGCRNVCFVGSLLSEDNGAESSCTGLADPL